MTFKEYLLMLWLILFSIMCSIAWVDESRQIRYSPDSAAYIVGMMFFTTSFAVFAVGIVCLAT
jgi:hypothetical protein